MGVTVHEVQTRKQLGRFIHFPYKLYKKNKYWIPPLLMDEWRVLSADKNPAFNHCRVKLYLAERDGQPVGRIAGIINERGNVLGMMPHPERTSEALMGGEDGLFIWRSILASVEVAAG